MARQRRKEHRPEEILDAAINVFSGKGFAATRMSDIALRAGVSRPTLYLYYKNKMDIFEALLEQRLRPIVGEAQLAIGRPHGSSGQLLRQVVEKIIRTANHPDVSPLLRMIITEGPTFPELTNLYFSQMMNPGRAVIREILKQGVERGEFKPSFADVDSRLFVGPAILGVLWQILFSSSEQLDLDQLIEDHFSLILSGLEVEQPGDK